MTLLDIEMPRPGTIKNMHVRHSTPTGNGNDVTYTALKNGVDTSVTVTMASTDASGSDSVNTEDYVKGERLAIKATKPLNIGNGALDVTVTLEFA